MLIQPIGCIRGPGCPRAPPRFCLSSAHRMGPWRRPRRMGRHWCRPIFPSTDIERSSDCATRRAKRRTSSSPLGGHFLSSGAHAMNKMTIESPPPDGTKLPALTPASYRILRLLQKDCAYQARGTWRFRGSHGPTNVRTLDGLLEKGLAERVEIDRHAQVRITAAGRSVHLGRLSPTRNTPLPE
jgi:hypothetical protein